jgi:hypothetical protein
MTRHEPVGLPKAAVADTITGSSAPPGRRASLGGGALGVIAGILLIAVMASVMRPHQSDVVTTPADPQR